MDDDLYSRAEFVHGAQDVLQCHQSPIQQSPIQHCEQSYSGDSSDDDFSMFPTVSLKCSPSQRAACNRTVDNGYEVGSPCSPFSPSSAACRLGTPDDDTDGSLCAGSHAVYRPTGAVFNKLYDSLVQFLFKSGFIKKVHRSKNFRTRSKSVTRGKATKAQRLVLIHPSLASPIEH